MLNQILCARAASGSGAALYFWRDVHGTEVDFVIEQNGRLRLIEAKWAENGVAAGASTALRKVRALLGKRDAGEHWLVCRTARSHTLAGDPTIRVVDGVRFEAWLSS